MSTLRLAFLLLVPATLAAALLSSPAVAQTPSPKIVLSETVIDLGDVPRGTKPVARFTVENQGDATLSFPHHTKSCACAEVVASDIPAKQSGLVTVEIDTLKLSGPSSAQVTLVTNDPATSTVALTVKVLSRDVLVAEPGYFRYLVHQHFTEDSTIKQVVASTDEQEFEVTRVESPSPHVTVGEARPAEDAERMKRLGGSQWVFEARLDPKAAVGALRGNLLVHTTHPTQKVMPIPLSGFVRPVFAFTPPELDLGSFTPRAGTYREIDVQQFGRAPITIESVTSDVEGLTFETRELEPGRKWKLRVLPGESLAKGPLRATVTITSSSSYLPKATFEVRGTVN